MHNGVTAAARPGHHVSTLLERHDLSDRYFHVVMSRPRGFENPQPGTFIHLLVPGGGRFFLRRPFSILDCNEKTISLIIVEKGMGTRILRRIPVGTDLDFIGPLGTSFPRASGKRVLAVGGGVGLAPLYFFGAGDVVEGCKEYRLLYGARTKADLFIDRFEWSVEGVEFSTDDGSHGFAGSVVELARNVLARSEVDVVFSCGPTPMLRGMAELAHSKKLAHFVSLENRMACGMGACRSCVVPTRVDGAEVYRTVCKDGPVFDADVIVWENLPDI